MFQLFDEISIFCNGTSGYNFDQWRIIPCYIEWVIIVLCQFSNFSAISWREQVNFQWDDDEVCLVLDQHVELDVFSDSSLKQISRSTQTHYPDSEPTSLCSVSLMLHAQCRSKQIPISQSLVWPDRGLNLWSNALEVTTLTITPLMRFHVTLFW